MAQGPLEQQAQQSFGYHFDGLDQTIERQRAFSVMNSQDIVVNPAIQPDQYVQAPEILSSDAMTLDMRVKEAQIRGDGRLAANMQMEMNQSELEFLGALPTVKSKIAQMVSQMSPEQQAAYARGEVPPEITQMLLARFPSMTKNEYGFPDHTVANDLAMVAQYMTQDQVQQKYVDLLTQNAHLQQMIDNKNKYWAMVLSDIKESIELSKSV